MKICKHCNEESEDNFDVCWNCGKELESKVVDLKQNKNDIKTSKKIKNTRNSLESVLQKYDFTLIVLCCYSMIGGISLMTLNIFNSGLTKWMTTPNIIFFSIIIISQIGILLGIVKIINFLDDLGEILKK